MPSEFEMLNGKQKRLVRRLAWRKLRAYDPAIVLVPVASVFIGVMVGVLFGVAIGRFLLFASHTIPGLIGAFFGAVIGAFASRPLIEQRRRYFYRDVIADNREEINGLD